MNTVITYFRESLEELRHVRWPTQQQAIRLTIVVIIFIAITSLAFGIIDAGFSEILRLTLPL